MPDESAEVIEQKMSETRDSLSQKVSALESQVVDTLQSATATVSSMMEQVKTAVPETIASVKQGLTGVTESVTEQVKASLDLSHHTRERPWAMVGGAAAMGFITGMVLFRRTYSAPAAQSGSTAPRAFASVPAPTAASSPLKLPGWLDQIVDRLTEKVSEEVRKLGEVAVSTASSSLQQSVEHVLPTLLGSVAAREEPVNRVAQAAERNGFSSTPR